MNIYESKFSGSEIDDILTKARVLCLEIGKTRFEELRDAVENNSPIFLIQNNQLYSVLSYSWDNIFVIIKYWDTDLKIYKDMKLCQGKNGEVVESEVIPYDGTIKIVIDKFLDPQEGINTKQDRAEFEGFSNWEEYLEWYLEDTESPIRFSDTYHHTAATIEWDGAVYDIWSWSYFGIDGGSKEIKYILTEKHDLSYFKGKSLKENSDNAWCPFVAMLDNDLNISEYNSEKVSLDWLVSATYDIESNETERLWFDSLLLSGKDQKDVIAEEYGYENWLDLVDKYIEDPETCGANYYYYIGETLEWEGNTYYLWESDAIDWDFMEYLITTTIDFDELYSHSLEGNPNNSWCPYVAILRGDKETAYLAEQRSDILVKVTNEDDLTIWFDDFVGDPPFYSRDIYEKWKNKGSNLVNYIKENKEDKINQFEYTGLMHKYNDIDYYLWVSTGSSEIQYILTSTINMDFLSSHSLLNDSNAEYCPYVATLDENLNVISHEGRNDWLLDSIPLYSIPEKDYHSNNTIRLWLDFFEVSDEKNIRESLVDEYGYSSWEEFVEFLSTGPIGQTDYGPYLDAKSYEYTGETLEIFGQTYYIWVYTDPGYVNSVAYLITSTIDFDELREESLVVNPEITESPSLIAVLSEDSDGEAYKVPEKEFELIVKVDKL